MTLLVIVVNDQWNICFAVAAAVSIAGFSLCTVSLLTLTAMSVDRLLALLLRLRYKQVVTLKRTYVIVGGVDCLYSNTILESPDNLMVR